MGEQTEEKKATKQLCLGILAHVDAGKTTLSESILYLTGSIRKLGRVDNRDAFLDTNELERARGITIFSKQAVFRLGDAAVTLMDTPGHVDFSAEMERTLQVLDYAVLVISGADGVQGHTETLWRLLKKYKIPVFLFINKMDQKGTDRDHLMMELKKRLHENCVDFGTEPEQFLDSLAMCDEELLESYLEQGIIGEGLIKKAIGNRKVFPCFFGSALKVTGVKEFLSGLETYMEQPDYPETFGAKVFKISRDDQGNRLTHLKITGGSLKVREALPGPGGDKINQIRIYSGSKYEITGEAKAGAICAVTGPGTTRPGQGLGAEPESILPVLEPVLTYKILLPSGCDANGILRNLRQMEEEDPLLHISWDETSGEIHAQVMGEVQMEILKSQIESRYGVKIEFGSGNIVYKETILETVEGVGHFEPLRHYAEVHLLMEPGEKGSGLQFAADCSEDLLDRNWQRLVLTHLEEKRHKGVLIGAEITDMKITLVAGRAHIKHTEGGDFRQATYRAVRQGLREAGCRLLEPYYEFRLEIPSESVGRAMADLERMQASFEPPYQDGDMSVLTGSGPVASMGDYQREVISYSKGRGRLFCTLKGYEPCRKEQEVAEAAGYDPEADLENPTGSVFCSHGAGYVVPWDEVKKHMHVESPFMKAARRAGASAGSLGSGVAGAGSFRSGGAGAGGHENGMAGGGSLSKAQAKAASRRAAAEEKELEEIFIRTYGERKQTLPRQTEARRVIRAKEPARQRQSSPKQEEPEEEYLLVDGYNIIFAWEELRELAEATIDGARYRLMDILCNYQGYRKCTLIVVFDAYKVVGNTGHALKYHNIHVVFTKEAETADQYIEKLAHKIGRRSRVTVATSDGLEQLIIRGQGCLLMSAADLREEVERISLLMEEENKNGGGTGRNYLLSYVDPELAEYLEKVRLGEEKMGGEQ